MTRRANIPVRGQQFGALRARKLDGWRQIVRNEDELVKLTRLNQSTFRLSGVIPTWTNFMQTSYYRDMTTYLDATMVKKMRAWWELMLECGDINREVGKREFVYCRLVLLCESVKRKSTRVVREPSASRLNIPEQRAGVLKDKVMSLFVDLTLC